MKITSKLTIKTECTDGEVRDIEHTVEFSNTVDYHNFVTVNDAKVISEVYECGA